MYYTVITHNLNVGDMAEDSVRVIEADTPAEAFKLATGIQDQTHTHELGNRCYKVVVADAYSECCIVVEISA